ncbi:MAG: DUF1501 domain-containing protein [Vicinamibacterales bacterium]
MTRRLTDVVPSRRDALKWGGLALAGTWVDGLVWPLDIRASGAAATPRGTARNVVFIELGGAISPMDCWDFKETRWTPKDLDVTEVRKGLYLSRTLFPQLVGEMDKVALVRSMQAPELIHFNGQYHTQAGRALNPAIAREIPAWGSVAAFELASQRRERDTFPTYVSTNLTKARAGSIGSGFLPTWTTGLDLDPSTVFAAFGGDMTGANTVLTERWELLTALSKINEGQRQAMGQRAADYQTFYDDAHKLLTDARWPQVFQASADDRQRYGDDEFGLGCILARNLLRQHAGTRVVYVYDGDRWDHHSGIFDHGAEWNHYRTCTRLDKGLVSLMHDLAAAPGSTAGKTLLDETLIVCQSEFGRTPGMNPVAGRDHYKGAYAGLYVGGGMAGGRIVGRTDADGSTCLDPGWGHKTQPFMDNTVATIYSALGIDWTKVVENTPSGRAYHYVDTVSLGGSAMMEADEIGDLFA